jgi:hypothetical protein
MPPPFAPSTAPPSGLPARLPSTALTLVLVTAADAAGLVLAVDLARHGVDAVVLGGPPTQSQAAVLDAETVALDTESQELLDDLDVLDRLIAAAPHGRTPAVMSAFEPLEVAPGALLEVLHERLIELGGATHADHTYTAGEADGARLNCYVDGPSGPITIRSRYTVRTDTDGAAADNAAAAVDGRVLTIGSAPNEIGRRLGDAYNLGWKLAAVLRGAPEWVVRTYATERAVTSRDASPPSSPLSLPGRLPPPGGDGVGAGERAPDAPVLSASGRPTRLATLLHGPHWTLLGYGLGPGERAALHLTARPGLHVHIVAECAPETPYGACGDLVDIEGEVRWAYGIAAGDWVLIRPDGLVSAIVAGTEFDRLREHLAAVGL